MPLTAHHKYIPTSTNDQCNGEIPSQHTKQSLNAGSNNGSGNSKQCVLLQNADRDNEKAGKDNDVRFSRTSNQSCAGRKWTNREKYLLAICCLLFTACIVFILIAFARDVLFKAHHQCHVPPEIRSIEILPSIQSPYNEGLPSLTLICNATGTPSPVHWWVLPDGTTRHGHTLELHNLTVQHSGTYLCRVSHQYNGKEFCSNKTTNITVERTQGKLPVCLTQHCVVTAAHLLSSMDQSADPCENFFQFACGNWNKNNPIPEDKASFNTFEKLHDDLQIALKAEIEKVGDSPLRKALANLGGWPVIDSKWTDAKFVLEDILGNIRGHYNSPVLIDAFIAADDKNSSVNIIQLEQPELSMPSRDYYLKDNSSRYMRAYLTYMIDIATLLGAEKNTAIKEMKQVLQFETALAKVSQPQNERHDTGARYKKITIKQLQTLVPMFDWLRYFRTFIPVPLDELEPVVVFAPEYLKDMIEVTRSTEKRVIANYILWRVIFDLVPQTTASFQQAQNEFEKVMQGILTEKPKWQKCVEYVNKKFGIASGAMFVRDNFRKERKEMALEMIHDIREAFNELLEENDWMDDETRAVAREKANAMRERISYPDFILEDQELDEKYKDLQFLEGQFFENNLRLELFDATSTIRKLREPVDKEKWEQYPAVVNAFYNPNTNDIVFPAGILQMPFYSEFFPRSLNFGGIGVVIGHEITHGFDDKGRQYDKDGNLKQWWKNVTIEMFRERTQCMIAQYSSYKLKQIDQQIDGKNTLGENIADNGGLKQAYRAYKKWEHKHGKEHPLPGLNLTHDQLFFLNYAQIWCGNMRDEEALNKIRSSVHSPGPIRVLGPLSNSYDFAKAYSCPLNSSMNPEYKCAVW
ncbi:hypothetical protein ACJMK2_007776 [Sinanodonta woodiana]|uniref:Ig-like domain-containing protein n=1 Tax=Sinanodonta woodiana TaxID=1069815 RepID=A0ABD3VL41_SINWO